MSESPVVEGVFVGREDAPLIRSNRGLTYNPATFKTDLAFISLCVTGEAISVKVGDLIRRQARCRVRTHLDKEGLLRIISITELDAVEEPVVFNPSKFLQALQAMP